MKENQIRLMATPAQRDAEVEKLNKILEHEEFRNLAASKNNFVSSPVDSSYFYSCQVGIAFDPWPLLEEEFIAHDSGSSGSYTRSYFPVRLQILLLTSL